MVQKLWLRNIEKKFMILDACDLDHDTTTLVLELDQDIVVNDLKMKSTGKMVQKVWLRDTEKFMLHVLYTCDPDFDLMTLVLELDPDVMVTRLYTRNEVSRSSGSKAMA